MLDFISDIENVPTYIKTYYVLATLFLYVVCIITIRKNKSKDSVMGSLLVISYMIVFSLFYCINSDYFNYRLIVANPLKYYTNGIIEITTLGIAVFCDGNYELFRLIVWGSSILVFFLTTKVLKLNSYISLLLWFAFFNGIIFYARATLAMALFFGGVSLIIRNKNIINLLIGAVIAISSVFFHREMLIALGLLPALYIKIDKSNYKRILLVVMVLVIPATLYVISNPSFLGELTNNETYTTRFESYQDQITEGVFGENRNIFGYAILFIRYVVYYLMLFVCGKVFIVNKSNHSNNTFVIMRKLYQHTFALVIVATLFLILFGFSAFFYRVLYITAIPFSLLISYLYSQKYISKQTVLKLVFYTLFVYAVNTIGI